MQEQGWFDEEENAVGALCARLSSDCAAVQGATGTHSATSLNILYLYITSLHFPSYKCPHSTLPHSTLLYLTHLKSPRIASDVAPPHPLLCHLAVPYTRYPTFSSTISLYFTSFHLFLLPSVTSRYLATTMCHLKISCHYQWPPVEAL